MKNRSAQNTRALYVVAATFALMEWAWFREFSLYGLFAVAMIAVFALAWVLRADESQPWPLPLAPQARPVLEKSVAPSRGRLVLSALGIGLLVAAYLLALKDSFSWVLAALVGAAFCWRPLLDVRPELLAKKWVGLLSLLVMALAALFRFYQAGLIPHGLIFWDEAIIYSFARDIVQGKREIYNMIGGDGQIPYWANAAAIHFFGDNITGFRMSPIFSGFIAVGLIALLGKELSGPRLGIVAGAFTAVAYWAVAFSRAEYLVASSYVPVLACVWLLLLGLRRGSPLALALSGLSFGASFSIYNGGKILPMFILVYCGLLWYRQRDAREPMQWALIPFAGGALIALSPLLLWAYHDPALAYSAYFEKLNQDWIAGRDVMAAPNFIAKVTILISRIIPNFNNVLPMFTSTGERGASFFFLQGQPIIDHCTLFLLLAGMAGCLARFRKPAYAMIFCWWFLAFVPALVATLQYFPLPRRIMMNLPATMLIAAVGFLTLFELITRGIRTASKNRLLLLSGLGFFAYYAVSNWNTYFVVINEDVNYLDVNVANFTNGLRAILAENAKAPVYLVNFRKTNKDDWLSPGSSRIYEDDSVFLSAIPQVLCQNDPGYFMGGGLFGALSQIPAQFPDKKPRDPLVVLTPFQYYLQPLLQKSLKAELVQEIFPVQSSTGPSWGDFGFAPHAGPVHRMFRLKGFKPQDLEALKKRWLFPYTLEELSPPRSAGRGDALAASYYNSPEVLAAIKNYDSSPESWKASNPVHFSLPDAYFWTTCNLMASAHPLPERLKAQWTLNIPKDGLYALGASATFYTSLRVDGKKVFSFIPDTPQTLRASSNGYLGKALFLKAGPHRLNLDYLVLTFNPINNQAIRLVWQRPGGQPETLPLEMLEPGTR